MRCEGCGAEVDETLAECAYCRTRVPMEPGLEAETRVMLAALESRLDEAMTNRTAAAEIIIFCLYLAALPACYFLLGAFTDFGLLVRIGMVILTAVAGFLVVGWQFVEREAKAEQIIWRDAIGPEIRVYADRKELANSELMVLAQRLLVEDSRLRKLISKWMIG